ncbi:MAG: antibiotic biosynthesis monooxygenase family protein [Thermoanaerobaculia bacterium]
MSETAIATQFVAISRFRVSNGMERSVYDAFIARPRMVDDVSGFIRMDVLCPQADAAEFWLVTVWQDEEAFRSWHTSHLYRDSHAGIPKGIKLDAAVTELRTFVRIPT